MATLILAAPLIFWAAYSYYHRTAPDVPIVPLELAGTVTAAGTLLRTTSAQAFRDALRPDFVYILGYVAALVLACVIGREVFWTSGTRRMAGRGIAAAIGAGLFDVAENLLLLDYLDGSTILDRDLTLRLAQAAAFAKFSLLAVAGTIAVVALLVTLSRLVLRFLRPQKRLVKGTDVLPPVQPGADAVGPATRWDSAWRVPDNREPAEVGISASGGGIRSACVTLGALQSLREAGMAYEELGVEIELDEPLELIPGSADPLKPDEPLATLNSRLSRRAICTGTITYPREIRFEEGPSNKGRLVVMKTSRATAPATSGSTTASSTPTRRLAATSERTPPRRRGAGPKARGCPQARRPFAHDHLGRSRVTAGGVNARVRRRSARARWRCRRR